MKKIILLLMILVACTPPDVINNISRNTADDWAYDGNSIGDSMGPIGTYNKMVSSYAPMAESIGFSVGGAKDIANFRENIELGFMPLETDITFEGLFYDYYFDTGNQECEKLFCPSYTYSISTNPLTKENEEYISVGLNSGITDFKRKKLNLVIVLDISGSMGSPFNKYYYDGNEEDEDMRTKMELAKESVIALLDHLNEDDRFGMVLFESEAHLAKPLSKVSAKNMDTLKRHIREISDRGGTHMSAGMRLGTELFDELKDADQTEYENRIIFLTDAMPNIGDTSEEGLLRMAEKNAENKIYTTFIGLGVDFNTALVESITKTRGSNYYSVHSGKEFMQRMDEEFEFMVTPLVFNLNLHLEAQGYDIERVYGSPEANKATGEIMKVNTLFPSATKEGETRGGLVLLKLKKLSEDASLTVTVDYEDREGKKEQVTEKVSLPTKQPDYYDNTGIRKGILLSRYGELMKNWIRDDRQEETNDDWINIEEHGRPLGDWERQSQPLHVSEKYKEKFEEFKRYFEQEMDAIGDKELEQELKILNDLSVQKE